MSEQKVTIRKPDDMHAHFRDGAMRRLVAPLHRPFARAVAMPNVPAIHAGAEAASYRDRIESAADGLEVLPCIKLTHRTTPEMIKEARECGVLCAKLYPEGATTASHDGISDPWALRPVYEAMADCGMVLCIHGEEPSAFIMNREDSYQGAVIWIARKYTNLRVVFEHITTMGSVRLVADGPANLAATITAHHLICTLDDVLADGLHPHNFCYPVPKWPGDRTALFLAARTCDRAFFGSDSAPHTCITKESACGCAGVFSAPVAMSVLAGLFFRDGPTPEAVKHLQAFTSERGADFYGLPRNQGTITLVREPWTVPDSYGDVVPFRAGETLDWRVDDAR